MRTHLVVVLVLDTALRKYRLWKSQIVVRVSIEQCVVVTDGRVVVCCIHTGAISVCLVGVVHHVVLTFCVRHTSRNKSAQGDWTNRLVLQLSTEHKFVNVDVVIVVLQLVEDIETCIETSVVDVRVKTAAGVHSVAERVDIEVTLYLTSNHVGGLVERTWSLLLTMAALCGQFHGEVAQDVVWSVAVEGVTLHAAAVDILSRVIHQWHREVTLRFLSTATNTYRVVLRDAVREQQVEPVGVAEFCSLEVSVARSLGVLQSECSWSGVVFSQLLEHVSVDTGVLCICKVLQLEPSLVCHFLVNTHDLLWVHDVIVGIRRLQTCGELTSIVNCGTSLAASLCGDNDHTSHSAGTIDWCCRTVLKNGERLDVVRVKTSHSWRNKGLGVTWCQFVCTNVNVVLIDHTVDNPQRLGVTIDGGSTTHANLWWSTECTADVGNLHTGNTTFERAADISHTRKFSLVCVNLWGCTGEETLVHLLHTSYHNLVNLLCSLVRMECNLHSLSTL